MPADLDLAALEAGATRHAFLDAVREGTIADEAFDTWLVQDARFVADLLAFQARLLARAPRRAQAVLAGGCAALVAELDWFAERADERGLDLAQPPLPATVAYADLLRRLDAAPWDAAVTALAVLERVYLHAWSYAAPSSGRFRDFVEHWTAPGFAEYVRELEALGVPGHGELVAQVLAQEVAFWDMALDPGQAGTGSGRRSGPGSQPAAGTLSARLWDSNRDLAEASRASPFVRGIADGSLPRPAFAGYVAQDAFFLASFARAYALALARSPDTGTLLTLADLLAGVRDELGLHASYAVRWGIEVDSVEPAPAALAYTDFLLATATTGTVGVVLAAMTPCMRLYAALGQTLDAAQAGAYAEWVTTYSDPVFEALAARLEGLLDEHADDTAEVRAVYRRAMRLELEFFAASA